MYAALRNGCGRIDTGEMSAISSDVAFKRFAECALADRELELEIGLDMPVSPPMFRRLVKSLRETCGQPQESFQLDVFRESARFEYAGQDSVAAALSPNNTSSPIHASRVLIKRREMPPVPHEDYEYTIKLKREMDVTSELGTSSSSPNLSARFRLKRRFSFAISSTSRVDCTAVQEREEGGTQVVVPLKYEVEVEFVRPTEGEVPPEAIVHDMSSTSLKVMCLMMGTSRPLTRNERKDVLASLPLGRTKNSYRLMGPQPVTLTLKHVQPPGSGADASTEESIWEGAYTVTDKADGIRCQLFVHKSTAYTVDGSAMVRRVAHNVAASLNGTWLDGELITSGKAGQHLNLFATFDAYAMGERDITALPLMDKSHKCRLDQAKQAIEVLQRSQLLDGFQICVKTFCAVDVAGAATRSVWESAQVRQPYHTDGLIFTPARLPVGGRYEGDDPQQNGVWHQTLKWKPPEMNTIDFLVRASIKRNQKDAISLIPNPNGGEPLRCVTFDIFSSYIPKFWEPVDVSKYIQFGERSFPSAAPQPRRFDVEGEQGGKLHVQLDPVGRPVCQDGDPVYTETIVECAYSAGTWHALRLRPEKTARLPDSIGFAANDWGTALSVWESIVSPVSEKMILRLADAPPPPSAISALDAYYQRRTFGRERSSLREMANFHNAVVKDMLYKDARRECAAAGTPCLFEMACGKGGDMSRWADNGFDPIVGIDLSMDNITNADNGVYLRIARHREALKGRTMAFVCMDATTRMRPPLDQVRMAAANSPHGDVISALWDTNKRPLTNTAFSPLRGLMLKGFDVVSCQFSIHYMFENDIVLDHFVQNVAYLLRPGGVFIGTCFDGDRLAKDLESEAQGSLAGRIGGHVAWHITRAYDGKFAGSTGASIDVFVETINQTVREYLVSPRLLSSRLEAHGLTPLYIKPFSSLFQESPLAQEMSAAERTFSEKNMMFAFKKTRGTESA